MGDGDEGMRRPSVKARPTSRDGRHPVAGLASFARVERRGCSQEQDRLPESRNRAELPFFVRVEGPGWSAANPCSAPNTCV